MTSKWPDEETGINSVKPWTRPKIIAVNTVIIIIITHKNSSILFFHYTVLK